MVLLHALHQLGRRNLVVVHVDHRLRGRASTADARFVKTLATRLEYPIFSSKADTRSYAEERGISIELAARELRHVAFAAASRRFRTRHVLLAHHAGDQVETCLFNYLRGSGLAGLAGMDSTTELTPAPGIRITLHRPLLGISREEITRFAETHGITWREDASNATPDFTRNRMRAELLPLADAIMDGRASRAILRTAIIARDEHEYLDSEANAVAISDRLDVAAIRALHPAIQRRVILRWLRDFAPPGCGHAEVESIRSLLTPASGPAKINLPRGAHVRRRGGILFFEFPPTR